MFWGCSAGTYFAKSVCMSGCSGNRRARCAVPLYEARIGGSPPTGPPRFCLSFSEDKPRVSTWLEHVERTRPQLLVDNASHVEAREGAGVVRKEIRSCALGSSDKRLWKSSSLLTRGSETDLQSCRETSLNCCQRASCYILYMQTVVQLVLASVKPGSEVLLFFPRFCLITANWNDVLVCRPEPQRKSRLQAVAS